MDEIDKTELDLNAFPCEEYVNDAYYSRGLFHPTEARKLLPNGEAKISRNGNYLTIGWIYDDHDAIICYRKSELGVWVLNKSTGNYHLLGETLKEFVEGWYPTEEKFYWTLMTSQTQWQEIISYYTVNQERYQWKTEPFLDFIRECVALQLQDHFFIKAHQDRFSISSENGFIARPQKKMAIVYLDPETGDYGINYNLDFFKEYSRKTFSKNEMCEAIKSIMQWVDKKNEE